MMHKNKFNVVGCKTKSVDQRSRYYSGLKQVNSGIISTMFPIPKICTRGDNDPFKRTRDQKMN